MAMAISVSQVPADKVQQHQQLLAELNGPRRAAFEASRRRAGIRERGFIQPSSDGGYLYIDVVQAENPVAAFQAMLQDNDEFSHWFFQQIEKIHGASVDQGPPPLAEPVIDSAPRQVPA